LLSTVLSLIFVPAVFVLLDDVSNLLWRFFGRFIGPVDEPPAEEAAPARTIEASQKVEAQPTLFPASRAAE
jgi:hypothetical protein